MVTGGGQTGPDRSRSRRGPGPVAGGRVTAWLGGLVPIRHSRTALGSGHGQVRCKGPANGVAEGSTGVSRTRPPRRHVRVLGNARVIGTRRRGLKQPALGSKRAGEPARYLPQQPAVTTQAFRVFRAGDAQGVGPTAFLASVLTTAGGCGRRRGRTARDRGGHGLVRSSFRRGLRPPRCSPRSPRARPRPGAGARRVRKRTLARGWTARPCLVGHATMRPCGRHVEDGVGRDQAGLDGSAEAARLQATRGNGTAC